MAAKHPRMLREEKTIEAMLTIYCNDHHKTKDSLCAECEELLAYSKKRLDKCPFQERKTTCGNCRIHCYRADMREKAKNVMRYSGPRMLRRHPLLAVLHIIDDLKKEAGRR